MTKSRRKFTAEQKAASVRRHLKGKESISSLAEEMSIQPTQIHQWVAMVVDQAERAFEKTAKSEKASKRAETKINELNEQRIKKLEEKLIHKNEVIAELMEENVKAKKANGDLYKEFGSPTTFATRSSTIWPTGPSVPISHAKIAPLGKAQAQQVPFVEETLRASQFPQRKDSEGLVA
ncbi:MAG: transposase [Planctomycetes bacterium]|nr:transposase [Planctomycetota bacterium]